ncbi:NAD(P)/FAD-dependent oxidoreductase [Dongia sedimenti]|uniref:FAD-binding oxidoreductase n=1 Tax=Dongia sedimenti TaxID=3064282 RepID=A0ABU0YI09_9PROT|nr:FAD-binding oxidoreductase [Rhodospirillaceae bacterium R-7]
MTTDCDFLVIGAGVSGAAAASELAALGSTILLEMEDQPGYHSSGRSAALYTPNYGPAMVREICQAAGAFFDAPPPGFAEHPLLTPRGALTLGIDDPEGAIDALLKDAPPAHPIEEISLERAIELCPLIRPGVFRRAIYEPGVRDMDAAAIHQGYLRGFKARDGRLAVSAQVTALERSGGAWTAVTASGRFRAPVVVNAAGAWADRIGALAGATRIGLQPCLRTVILVEVPPEFCRPSQPVGEVIETWHYFKPEAGRILASPGDETPVDPMDAYPDDMVIAELADYLERHTLLKIERVLRSWAGLRSFVPDHCPVAGPDPRAEGFFWLAGQGGYGIMMSPVLGRATASLIDTGALPEDLKERGLTPADLAPGRAALRESAADAMG